MDLGLEIGEWTADIIIGLIFFIAFVLPIIAMVCGFYDITKARHASQVADERAKSRSGGSNG